MTKKIKLIGLIVFAVMFSLIITACNTDTNDSGSGSLPVLTGSVIITGTILVGGTLTADVDELDGLGTVSYQWLRGNIQIANAKSSTYIIQDDDIGFTISVTVTRTGYSGNITSLPTIIVSDPNASVFNESFIISFANFLEISANITGPDIILLGSPEETIKTITVSNPAQYDSNSIKWMIGGNQITGNAISGTHGQILTLNSSVHNGGIGTHFVTVIVSKDNIQYSKIISFTVSP